MSTSNDNYTWVEDPAYPTKPVKALAIYRTDVNDEPCERLAECATVEEVLTFPYRLDTRYKVRIGTTKYVTPGEIENLAKSVR